jgi:hypothetical protein
MRPQQVHKTKTKVASGDPIVVPDRPCTDARFEVLERPYQNKEDMCMGISLPADFPAEMLAIVWIQRFEAFGPLNAYLWASKNLAELQGIDRNAMRGILLSSHGPENKLLQIMLEDIRRVGAHTCCVINKGCGFHDWVGKLGELASKKGVDIRQVQAISIDLADFDGRDKVVALHPDEQYFPDGGQADIMGSSLGMMRCPGEFAAGVLEVFTKELERSHIVEDITFIEGSSRDKIVVLSWRMCKAPAATPEQQEVSYKEAAQKLTDIIAKTTTKKLVEFGPGEFITVEDEMGSNFRVYRSGCYLNEFKGKETGTTPRPRPKGRDYDSYVGGSLFPSKRSLLCRRLLVPK